MAAIGRSERGQDIKVGIFSSLASGFLSESTGGLRHGACKCTGRIFDGDPADHVASIRRLQLDVAFIMGTHSGRTAKQNSFWSERSIRSTAQRPPLSPEKPELSWSDLAGDEIYCK